MPVGLGSRRVDGADSHPLEVSSERLVDDIDARRLRTCDVNEPDLALAEADPVNASNNVSGNDN